MACGRACTLSVIAFTCGLVSRYESCITNCCPFTSLKMRTNSLSPRAFSNLLLGLMFSTRFRAQSWPNALEGQSFQRRNCCTPVGYSHFLQYQPKEIRSLPTLYASVADLQTPISEKHHRLHDPVPVRRQKPCLQYTGVANDSPSLH